MWVAFVGRSQGAGVARNLVRMLFQLRVVEQMHVHNWVRVSFWLKILGSNTCILAPTLDHHHGVHAWVVTWHLALRWRLRSQL